jgi:glycine/D-amino acid oxidase-like deaminating enzyme
MRDSRVLVVGGGIAGLATARALLRRGIQPDEVERAAAWPHKGCAGLPAGQLRAGAGRARAPGRLGQVPGEQVESHAEFVRQLLLPLLD